MDDNPMHEVDLERRIRHLEREFAQVQVMLGMQATSISEIKSSLDGLDAKLTAAITPKPVNWPGWIGSILGALTVFGGLLYASFIQPLEMRMHDIKSYGIETRAHLRDIGDYAKETRAVLDSHTTSGEKHVDNGTD